MGVRLMNLASGDSVVGLALNAESLETEALDDGDEPADQDISADLAGLDGEADPADPAGADEDAEE
jgi:hypothetical protein